MILFSVLSILTLSAAAIEPVNPPTPRQLSETISNIPQKEESGLELFTFNALEYHPFKAFTDVFLLTNLTDSESYELYQGPNCTAVLENYQQDNRLFGMFGKSVSFWRNHLQPFNDTVIGIDTSLSYRISIRIWKVNYIRVGIFIGGILLFLFSSNLVRNTLFYYTSGCSFGVLASLLLVAFLVYRVAPKKTIGIPIILGGWSVSLYMLHFAWSNLSSVLLQYQKFVAAYFITVILISFAVCYKKGPPTDTRSHDIAQWTLQLVALIAIYFSTQVPEVSLGVMGILVLHQLTKSWLWTTCYKISRVFVYIWRKIFPVKQRLLTIEEYENQKKETTEKELKNLRNFCRSSNADAWKITNSVKNPKKLARFIDGVEDHVSDEELSMHDHDAEFLDRVVEELPLEEDTEEWEEEIIYRRTPKVKRGALATTQSIRLSRGMSARMLAEKLAASAGANVKPTSRLTHRPHRHSIASSSTGLPPRPDSSNSRGSSSVRSGGRTKSSKHDRSEYFSSDSEHENRNSELSEDSQ